MKLFLILFLSCAVFYVPCHSQSAGFKGSLKWQITKNKVDSFYFTPDGSFILLVGKFNYNLIDFDSNSTYAGEIEAVEAETGKTVSRLGVCGGKFGFSLGRIASRSNILAVSCKDGTLQLWDIKQAKLLKTIRPRVGKEIDHYELSPNGKRLITFEEDNSPTPYKAVLWDAESGALLKVLTPDGGGNFATSAAFSPDGKMLAVSYDGFVYLRNAVNGELLYKLADGNLKGFPTRSHNAMVYVLLFTPDGKKLITGSVDKLAKIWNTESGSLEHILAGHKSRIDMGAISDNGKMLATIDYDKGIKFWDIETGKLFQQLKASSYPYIESSFSPDRRYFFSPTEKGAAVWEIETGTEVWSEKTDRAALSPGGKWFLSYNKKEKKLEMFEFSKF